MNDFGREANPGVLLGGRVAVPVSDKGLSVFGEAFWGRNGPSRDEGDENNPYGLMGGVELDLGTEGKGGAYFFGEIGVLFHQLTSDVLPSDTRSGMGYGVGAGYGFPVRGVRGRIEGRAMNASVDGDNTAFLAVIAGVAIPVSGS